MWLRNLPVIIIFLFQIVIVKLLQCLQQRSFICFRHCCRLRWSVIFRHYMIIRSFRQKRCFYQVCRHSFWWGWFWQTRSRKSCFILIYRQAIWKVHGICWCITVHFVIWQQPWSLLSYGGKNWAIKKWRVCWKSCWYPVREWWSSFYIIRFLQQGLVWVWEFWYYLLRSTILMQISIHLPDYIIICIWPEKAMSWSVRENHFTLLRCIFINWSTLIKSQGYRAVIQS